MKYKYIEFLKVGTSASGKTSRWICQNINSGDDLGEVVWYGSWRQYCFLPDEGAIFSADCLADIQDFLSKAKQLHDELPTHSPGVRDD